MTATRTRSAALKGDALKKEILRVAMEHFATRGFPGTNMDEIAEQLNIHKPSIYYHIGKKEDLFAAVINTALDEHLQHLEIRLQQADTPEQQLKAYIQAFADNFSGENRYLANMILREVASQDGYFPQSAMEKMMRVQKTLRIILADGVDKNKFKPANPFVIHMLIVGFFTTYAASEAVKKKIAAATDDREMLDQNISLHEAGDLIFTMLSDSLTPE